eukprot:6694051-Prymnesium_polylepis.1
MLDACGRRRVDNALTSKELALERAPPVPRAGKPQGTRNDLGASFFLSIVCATCSLKRARSCTTKPVVDSAAASGR